MMERTYTLVSVCTVLFTWYLYVKSWISGPTYIEINVAYALVLVLCIPLVALFLKVRKKKERIESTWRKFWTLALQGCPDRIWGLMTPSFVMMIIGIIGSMFFNFSKYTVISAWLSVVAIAALSYSITLITKTTIPNKSVG